MQSFMAFTAQQYIAELFAYLILALLQILHFGAVSGLWPSHQH